MRHLIGHLSVDRKDSLDARNRSCSNISVTDIGHSKEIT